ISLLLAASISGSSLLTGGRHSSLSDHSLQELSIFHLDEAGMPVTVSSGKLANPAIFFPHCFIPKNTIIRVGSLRNKNLIDDCLFINAFIRNAFYTFVSIHAP